jgi:DNA-binding response OmpR family regulator
MPMPPKLLKSMIMIANDSAHARRLIADVLRGSVYEKLQFAADGSELLKLSNELLRKVVITASRIPGVSGLEFARMVRMGMTALQRTCGIIVKTDTPTAQFLAAARTSGVDEMMAAPFTAQAILARVESVLLRPRKLVESHAYIGPCRRRRMLDDYGGPMRRFSDPIADFGPKEPWKSDDNRELVRQCVTRLSEMVAGLSPLDRRALREVYAAAQGAESTADSMRDVLMADAARSLGRYIVGVGASGALDIEVVTTHIDAMKKLGMLGSKDEAARQMVVGGLTAIVHKRLGRKELATTWAG